MVNYIHLLNLFFQDQLHTEIVRESINHPFLFKDINMVLYHILHESANSDYITFARSLNAKLGIMYDIVHSNPTNIHYFGSNYQNISNFDFFYHNESVVNYYEIKQITFSTTGYREDFIINLIKQYELFNKSNHLVIDLGCRNQNDRVILLNNLQEIVRNNLHIKSYFKDGSILVENRNLLKPNFIDFLINNINTNHIRLLCK